MECGCCRQCVSSRAGAPKAPLELVWQELELRKEKVLDGAAGGVRSVLELLERGQSPAEGVRMELHTPRSCAVIFGKVSACGVCLGKVPACVLSAPKGPQGWCKQRMGLGRPQGSLGGLWGSERGGILPFQAIFAALGLCCLGGKDAGGGCCCCWQLLRSSAAAFPWLPNPKLCALTLL